MKFLVPGHKYLGPGNPLFNGEPVNKADSIAQSHDWDYATSKSKEDIFSADNKAINDFNKDLSENFNFSSLIGSAGLSIKHGAESLLNTTLYPWNMPTAGTSSSLGKSRNREDQFDQVVPNKQARIDGTGESSTENIMADDDGMVGDQAVPGGSGNNSGGGSSLHGQTARIFSGYPQEPNWTTLTYKKTYRFTYDNVLPGVKLSTNGDWLFRIGSALRIPVERLAFYLSPCELHKLTNDYEICQVLETSCDVYNYGVRLPFTTNESNSVTANASAQYPLCQWIGLEEDYDLYEEEKDAQDALQKCVGSNQSMMEGATTDTWKTDIANLSARATSREFHNEAILVLKKAIINNVTNTTNVITQPNTNEYAHVLNGTMNLGKVFSWQHHCKNGLISQKHRTEANMNYQQYFNDVVTFPNATSTLPGTNITGPKEIEDCLSQRVTYHGLYGLSDEKFQSMYGRAMIDGWISFPINAANAGRTKIKPFIVGLQFLRNKDDTLLQASWEFALVSTITLRVKLGTRGVYSTELPSNTANYVGLDPLYTFSSDRWMHPENSISSRGHVVQGFFDNAARNATSNQLNYPTTTQRPTTTGKAASGNKYSKLSYSK